MRGCVVLAVATVFLLPAAPARSSSQAPVVIAVMEEAGHNVLHADFRTRDGSTPPLPVGAPPAELVSLPESGTFADRLAAARAGPLGHIFPGSFIQIAGTRLLVYYREESGPQDAYDILADRFHGTGVASSAGGLVYGTNSDALLVLVPNGGAHGWSWVASQPWIDMTSSSNFTVLGGDDLTRATCPQAREIRSVARDRVVFAAAGNSELIGLALSPSGAPGVYRVGAVDADGRTRYLPRTDQPLPRNDLELFFMTGQVTRPYETGELFDFPAASPDALDGPLRFGGTSGATPRTAGRAAELVAEARLILGDTGNGVRDGVYAAGPNLVGAGPLTDGRFNRDELTALLHATATPFEPPSTARYWIEGYGWFDDRAQELAVRVLRGVAAMPQRDDEDAAHVVALRARDLLFPQARCG